MVKKRIHEVAKELNIESKELIQKLGQMGISVKSPLSTMEGREIEQVAKTFREGGEQKAEAKVVVKQEAPAPAQTEPEEEKQSGGRPVQTDRRPERQTEKRKDAPPKDGRRRGGPGKPEQNWPGMVDRVPSRPPDRRFQERPAATANQPGKPWGQPGDKREAEQTQDSLKREQPQDRPSQAARQDRPPQDRSSQGPRQDRPPQNRPSQGPRQDRPPQDRPSQGPRQDRPPQSRAPYNRPADGAAAVDRQARVPAGAVRPGFDRPQPAAGPAGAGTAGRPPQQRPYNRGPQAGPRPGQPGRGSYVPGGPSPRPAGDQSPRPPARTQGVAPAPPDKPKAVDNKPKPAKPAGAKDRVKGRSDKRAAMAATAEAKLRQRTAGQRRKGPQRAQQPVARLEPIEKKPVVMGESITVQELAQKLHKGAAELIKKLMHLGVMTTINQEIDADTAGILAGEFGYEIEIKLPVDLEAVLMQEPEEDAALMEWRPCVVTVMGHVDHGKTSLLDAIRETNVTATEAGGITQHIGAYQVEHKGKKITFVDTPGHEAFTAMRARGANVTDIVVLVVAADDGVMPQTVEAINHAKDARVPIIVAINKIDKPGANPDRVKQELTEHGLVAEQWGGETICVEVSALKKQGIPELLEMVLLVAELGEIKANPNRPARGTVIEAELDKGRGPVATVLVQNGSLNVGDTIIAGPALCRVRAMVDDKGRRIKKAGPSTPVEVIGFSEMPVAGDPFVAVTDEKLARTIAGRRQVKRREEELRGNTRVSLEDLFKRIQEGQIKELGIIVKADVQGSVEALRQSLERLNTGEVKVNIIHGGVGAITETDVMLASASNAIIIGFNVRPDVNARKAIELEKVDTRLYRVIYDAIEDVKKAMSGLLEPEYRELMLGRVEIRKIFRASKIGTIAGCYVLEGKIERDAQVRVVRDGIVVHEGKLDSLKRFKDDAKEVATGYECGIALDKFNEIEEGDIIEAFTMEAIKRELS